MNEKRYLELKNKKMRKFLNDKFLEIDFIPLTFIKA
jgi:hypothetical protein